MALLLGLLEPVEQRPVGEFHGDDQEIANAPCPENGEQMRVANILDDFERFLLDLSDPTANLDKLERDMKAPGALCLPDFPEAAAAQPGNQNVAEDRFQAGMEGRKPLVLWIPLRDFIRRGRGAGDVLHPPIYGCKPLHLSAEIFHKAAFHSLHLEFDELLQGDLGIRFPHLFPVVQ
jgi:hypothetical protein